MEIIKRISTLGACCPMPLIEVEFAMRSIEPGQAIEITGDDPVINQTLQDYCLVKGYRVIDTTAVDRVITMTIQK